MSKIIRISDSAYRDLAQLEAATGNSKQQILEEALEIIKREMFFKKLNEEYEVLQSDDKAWQEELEERAEWESINDIEGN